MAKRPIVLVHGAWHGPWCWERVGEALRDSGHDVHTPTLPGHNRPGDTRRNWSTIGSYLRTVEQCVSEAGPDAVLVGHSMGGYLTQRHLETHTCAAGVLVASVPRRGVLAPNVRLLRQEPRPVLRAALTLDYSQLVESDDLVRQLFFAADTPDQIVSSTRAQLQNESALAVNTMIARWPRPKRVTSPVHVIAAERDGVFSLDEQHDLAASYDTEAIIIEGAGHDVMLEPQWPELVDHLRTIAAT